MLWYLKVTVECTFQFEVKEKKRRQEAAEAAEREAREREAAEAAAAAAAAQDAIDAAHAEKEQPQPQGTLAFRPHSTTYALRTVYCHGPSCQRRGPNERPNEEWRTVDGIEQWHILAHHKLILNRIRIVAEMFWSVF